MSKFEDEGFISTGMDEWSKDCRNQHKEWFELIESINKYGIKIIHKARIHPANRQECIGAAIFFRVLSLFEGVTILSERCMINETKVLLRALLEAIFVLAAVCKDKQVAEDFYLDHFHQRLKIIKRMKDSPSWEKWSKDPSYYNNRIKELKAIIDNKKITPRTTRYYAKRAGLDDFYITAYSMLSWTAHSNILDIGQYIRGESDDYISEVSWHPGIVDTQILMTSVESFVIALRSLNKLFIFQEDTQIEQFAQHYRSLYHRTKE